MPVKDSLKKLVCSLEFERFERFEEFKRFERFEEFEVEIILRTKRQEPGIKTKESRYKNQDIRIKINEKK